VAALTAYQALFGRTGVQSGSSVLIHAAAGGVGHFAVQMARNAGARVIGTASGGKQGFILALGAEFGIDYTRDEFPETVLKHFPQGVDFILDAVGGDTLARSYPLLKAGGRLVSTVQEPDARLAEEREAQASMVLVEPDGEMLGNLAQLFDLKKLKTQVQKIYPLSGAAEAHRVLEDGHVQGKLVLNL
jgi:NADPH:quinone reductase-like Zn-dependent oxidoreductase